jgi:hypothetical protein
MKRRIPILILRKLLTAEVNSLFYIKQEEVKIVSEQSSRNFGRLPISLKEQSGNNPIREHFTIQGFLTYIYQTPAAYSMGRRILNSKVSKNLNLRGQKNA